MYNYTMRSFILATRIRLIGSCCASVRLYAIRYTLKAIIAYVVVKDVVVTYHAYIAYMHGM